MKPWPVHAVFAAMLVGSLAAKELASDVLVDLDSVDRERAVMRIAQSHGLVLRDERTVGGNMPALAFEAPGCARPVVVVLRVTFDEEPVVAAARQRGDVLRYVYIGRSWEKPDRVPYFVERVKYAVLAAVGLSHYVPSAHLLLVDSPPGCRAADAIDWRDVWNRDYVPVARASTGLP
jgi:hypothetical protein